MGRLDRSEPYNWIECSSDSMPIRILGLADEQYHLLSRVLSDVRLEAPRLSDGTNIISSFVWSLNQAVRVCSNPAALYETGVAEFRTAQDAFIKAVRAPTKPCEHSKGAKWISPPAGERNRIAQALLAIEKIGLGLSDLAFDGVDPSRTPQWLAAGGAKTVRKTWGDKWSSDTGRRYRVPGSDPSQAPRSNDPRIFDRWYAAAEELELHDDVRWIGRLCRHTGARSMSPRGLTLYDYLVARPFPDVVLAPTKGSKGEHTLQLYLSADIDAELMVRTREKYPDYVSAWECREKNIEWRLRRTPLLSVNGFDEIPYWRYHRDFMLAARKADLCFVDFSSGCATTEYVTPQQLRHEYVFECLLFIETLPVHEQASARADLIRRMGWKDGEAMLRWYSHFFVTQKALSTAQRMECVPAASRSGSHGGSDDDDADVMTLLEEM